LQLSSFLSLTPLLLFHGAGWFCPPEYYQTRRDSWRFFLSATCEVFFPVMARSKSYSLNPVLDPVLPFRCDLDAESSDLGPIAVTRLFSVFRPPLFSSLVVARGSVGFCTSTFQPDLRLCTADPLLFSASKPSPSPMDPFFFFYRFFARGEFFLQAFLPTAFYCCRRGLVSNSDLPVVNILLPLLRVQNVLRSSPSIASRCPFVRIH